MTIDQINKAIMFGEFSNDQLNGITMSIKYARAQLAQSNKRAFAIGDKVKFSHNGAYTIGTVDSIKVKNIIVRVSPYGTYRVPANMLEAHEG